MKVIINGQEIEYTPAPHKDWKYSAGDPFIFPVTLGGYSCFIKKFEHKGPEDISGWKLLENLVGKNEPNISKVYDIRKAVENEKEVFYVFYEYLEGTTLDKYVAVAQNINLSVLADHMFSAINSLNKYGYWFADFCEKNIFCGKDGTFSFIDLDSTQRITDHPDNEMYGNKDYWILVFRFFTEALNVQNIRPDDFNGIAFNYLQVPFLILRLKLFFQKNIKNYNASELFNPLPQQLDALSPDFRRIYSMAINGREGLSPTEIQQLRTLIQNVIINNQTIKEVVVAPVNLPVIRQFTTNKKTVDSDERFTLSWNVENVDQLELYKNGAMFTSIDSFENSISLTDFVDGTRNQSTYQLVAYKGTALAKSDPITINLREEVPVSTTGDNTVKPPPNNKWIWIIGGLVLAAILAFFLYRYFSGNNSNYQINRTYLRQGIDSTLTIYGDKIPPVEKIIVHLNDTKVKIQEATKDSLVVQLPKTITPKPGGDTTSVSVVADGETNEAGSFIYLPPVTVTQNTFVENGPVVFNGRYLDEDNIKVFLGDIELPIQSQTGNALATKIPTLNQASHRQVYELKVMEGDRAIFSRNLMMFFDTTALLKLVNQAVWIYGQHSTDGKEMINPSRLPWPGTKDDARGFALLENAYMEDNQSYRVLWTHPQWVPQGAIRGTFPNITLAGKKSFNAKVGFAKAPHGITTTDGVQFQVWVRYMDGSAENHVKIIDRVKPTYSGALVTLNAAFPEYIPNKFSIELQVNARNASNVDWAAWVNPAIISRRLGPPRRVPNWDLHVPVSGLHHVIINP